MEGTATTFENIKIFFVFTDRHHLSEMSIEIDLQTVRSASNDTQMHHVPCEIEHNGEANVDQYFTSSQRPLTEDGKDSKCKLMFIFCQ